MLKITCCFHVPLLLENGVLTILPIIVFLLREESKTAYHPERAFLMGH